MIRKFSEKNRKKIKDPWNEEQIFCYSIIKHKIVNNNNMAIIDLFINE